MSTDDELDRSRMTEPADSHLPAQGDSGKVYAAYIEAELKAERDRRALIDARAMFLITSSGVMLGLVAGATAVVRGVGARTEMPSSVAWLGGAALILFFVAALLGLLIFLPRTYAGPDLPDMRMMVDDHWDDDETEARQAVATMNLMVIESLRMGTISGQRRLDLFGHDLAWRNGNGFRVKLVVFGSGVQIAAFVALNIATFVALAAW